MFKRIYYRVLLAVLPSVEAHLNDLAALVQKLDAFTNRIEGAIEEEAVKLANDAAARRKAVEAVEAAYDKRADASIGFIADVRKDLDKAREARDAVAKFLGL